MYIGERFIKIPYQEYALSLQHASIRKLTIMEWSLLRIIKDYSTQPDLNNNTLAHFYEKILGMDNCEMLLKPCIHGLVNLSMVQIEDFTDNTVVTKIRLNEVKITEKGLEALQQGHLLGQSHETDEIAYWDIISNSFMDAVDDYSDHDKAHSAKALAKNQAGKVSFMPENFLHAVNTGEIFKNTYYSRGQWVETVICAEEKEQWRTALLILEQTKDKVLKANFPVNDEVYELLIKMADCPFVGADNAANWDADNVRALPDNGLFGVKLTHTLLSSINYCDVVITTEPVYTALHSEDRKKFNGKQVIILGALDFQIDDFNGILYLPFKLPVHNLVCFTDKKDAFGLYVKHTTIEDKPLDVFFIQPMSMPNNALSAILNENTISFSTAPALLAVFRMPIFNIPQSKLESIYLKEISQYSDLKSIVQYAANISSTAKRIHVEPFSPELFLSQAKKLLCYTNVDELVANLKYIYHYYLNQFPREHFLKLLIDVSLAYSGTNRIQSIETILSTATALLPHFDIASFRAEASKHLTRTLQVADYDELYSGPHDLDYEKPIFNAFAEYSNFFAAIKSVESLIPDFVFYTKIDRDSLLTKMLECPNLVQVKQDVELMIATAVTHSDCAYFNSGTLWDNAKLIKDILDLFILPDGKPASIYIIDTCAFLNTPDILDYFRDNEIVRVPHTVLLELDRHKDNKGSSISAEAAAACRSIEAHTTQAKLGNLLTFEMEPRDYPELLPSGFAYGNKGRLSPDNLILSTAFRYKAFKPTIVTDDTNFRNISRSQGVVAIAWNVFIERRGGEAVRSSKRKKQATTLPEKAIVKPPVDAISAKTTNDCTPCSNFPIADPVRPTIDVPIEQGEDKMPPVIQSTPKVPVVPKDSIQEVASAAQPKPVTQLCLPKLNVGQTLTFGRYYQSNTCDLEDIKWIVLDKNEDDYLIISKYALDIKAFANEKAYASWRSSSIRQWLNEEFLNTAFTPEEQQLINTKQIFCDAAQSCPACTVAVSSPTKDKVFLLSYHEAAKYFPSKEKRIAQGTPYTGILARQIAQQTSSHAHITSSNRCKWLLRTNGPFNYFVSFVSESGNMDVNSGVKARKMIRPAMWISANAPDNLSNNQTPVSNAETATPPDFLEYYIFAEKTSRCPFDSASLTQQALQVGHRNGSIKKLNFQVCPVCKRLYSRSSSDSINLQDYKLVRKLLPSQIEPSQMQTYYQLKSKTSICPFDGHDLSYEIITVPLITDANTTKKLHVQRCSCCSRLFLCKVSSSVHLEMFALNRIDVE